MNLKTKLKKLLKNEETNHDCESELVNKDHSELADLLNRVMRRKAEGIDATEALKFLFNIDNALYLLEGQTSVRHGNGEHSKHRHIKYHDFFKKNIKSGESVLDIGCSSGELTNDIADAANPGEVYGIEIEDEKTQLAKKKYQKPNLTFVTGDATKDLPEKQFDVVTMSNVLEHIEYRPEMLKTLNEKYKPKRFIIRVPVYQRDWRVPLKDELGLDYRLDETHFIEYTQESFEEETSKAGLKIDHLEVRWGEIWAVLSSKN